MSARSPVLAIVVLMVSLSSAPLRAQAAAPLSEEALLVPGARVRLSATTVSTPRARPLVGRLSWVTADSLGLRYESAGAIAPAPLAIARTDLTALEVSEGRPGLGARRLVGAALGFGLAMGVAWTVTEPRCADCDRGAEHRESAMRFGLPLGALAALGGGALAGLGLRERWLTIRGSQ